MPEATDDVNLWSSDDHARAYLERVDGYTQRRAGDAELLAGLPAPLDRVLDLGCGDGRLLDLVRSSHPGLEGVAVDFSDEMLARARERFAGADRIRVVAHDLTDPLPADLGPFDAVVSSFAIHHLPDARKRSLFGEVRGLLRPGGVFANLEHVASATADLHLEFLARMGIDPADDDPSNKLAPVADQLGWLREAGFEHVDCHWKWRELALLHGVVPG